MSDSERLERARELNRLYRSYLGEEFFVERPRTPLFPMLEEVCLSVEETESVRLKDLEGLEQEECAQRMHISRPTFHRILESARRKVADSLTNGKAIRIDGGNFGMAISRFQCQELGHEWDVPFETMTTNPPVACPQCHSLNIQPVYPPGVGFGRRGWGRHGW